MEEIDKHTSSPERGIQTKTNKQTNKQHKQTMNIPVVQKEEDRQNKQKNKQIKKIEIEKPTSCPERGRQTKTNKRQINNKN